MRKRRIGGAEEGNNRGGGTLVRRGNDLGEKEAKESEEATHERKSE